MADDTPVFTKDIVEQIHLRSVTTVVPTSNLFCQFRFDERLLLQYTPSPIQARFGKGSVRSQAGAWKRVETLVA